MLILITQFDAEQERAIRGAARSQSTRPNVRMWLQAVLAVRAVNGLLSGPETGRFERLWLAGQYSYNRLDYRFPAHRRGLPPP